MQCLRFLPDYLNISILDGVLRHGIRNEDQTIDVYYSLFVLQSRRELNCYCVINELKSLLTLASPLAAIAQELVRVFAFHRQFRQNARTFSSLQLVSGSVGGIFRTILPFSVSENMGDHYIFSILIMWHYLLSLTLAYFDKSLLSSKRLRTECLCGKCKFCT